jgi:DNA invertase Pin-like site-specific DNA recombinase
MTMTANVIASQVHQISPKVTPNHLNRDAIVYVRQSTIAQVRHNRESTERQYALQEKAQSLGWDSSKIHIIDEDLGISGSGRTKRQGFQQLVASVSLGEVGAVFGLEISRLARSSADLMKLLELCGLFHTLVVDEDGIYDMSDFNDRLVLGLKGTMGEAELYILRSRMLGGKENAAKRGELRFPLPVGFVYDPNKKIIKDPDEQVMNAITTVFSAFRQYGSAYGVVKHFSENSLLFPKRAYGGAWDGKLTWATLTHSRVLGILHNPSYTGAYVYGRFHDQKTVDSDGRFIHHTVKVPKDQWKVFIPNHHEAYITWDEYESNLKTLALNVTNSEKSAPAREGAALLQGLVICGKCGRRMSVRYTGNGGIRPTYECKGRWEHGNKSVCTCVSSQIIDNAVSEKILSLMKSSEFEIALKLMHNISEVDQASDRSWKLALERTQYEADRAERQYMLTEPENRLVVRTLETAWNQKLQELEQLKKDYEAYCSKKVWNPSNDECAEIIRLAENIPDIWNGSPSYKEKKRIIRILLEDVTIMAEPRNPDFTIGLCYRSGLTETLKLTKPRRRCDVVRHSNDIIETVRELSASMCDKDVAAHMNERGIRTSTGKKFTEDSIQWIRYKHQIPSFYENSRSGLSVKEASVCLGISTGKVYYYIDKGLIPAVKRRSGWPWEISLDESKIAELKSLLL